MQRVSWQCAFPAVVFLLQRPTPERVQGRNERAGNPMAARLSVSSQLLDDAVPRQAGDCQLDGDRGEQDAENDLRDYQRRRVQAL